MVQKSYSIRVFLPLEVQIYKSIRLEALKNEPGNFGNSHALEAAFSIEQWEARLGNPNSACFGLYHNHQVIGLTSIIILENSEEAYLTQSYIRKEYRHLGLSRLLYTKRIDWAKSRNLKKLIVGHRESNICSKKANQHFGFVYTHQEMRTWPDDAQEPMLYYELVL